METTKRKYKKHKQGYSVSIAYYLRKEKEFWDLFVKNEKDGEPTFPLYIRVAFLGQTVKMRSRLNVNLLDRDYNDYMSLPHIIQFIENETLAIRHSIEEIKPDMIDNFKHSQWSSFYSNGCDSLFVCVQDVVMDRFRKELYKKFDLSKLDSVAVYWSTSTIMSLELLVSLGVKAAVATHKQFRPIINAISYTESIRFNGTPGPKYTLWDWELGIFQNDLNQYFALESVEWITTLTSIVSDYESIRYLESPKRK